MLHSKLFNTIIASCSDTCNPQLYTAHKSRKKHCTAKWLNASLSRKWFLMKDATRGIVDMVILVWLKAQCGLTLPQHDNFLIKTKWHFCACKSKLTHILSSMTDAATTNFNYIKLRALLLVNTYSTYELIFPSLTAARKPLLHTSLTHHVSWLCLHRQLLKKVKWQALALFSKLVTIAGEAATGRDQKQSYKRVNIWLAFIWWPETWPWCYVYLLNM